MNLTPYEMNRKPHVLPDESSFIYAPPRFLENELSCSICLDILRNTRTTKECLHRFCEECIGQALRSGNKECPNCRKKLVSMRSLRPDPIFDTLIRTIFPNRAELDKQQSDLLAKLDKNNNAKAFLTSIEEGMRHQAEKRSGPRAPRKIGKDTNQDGLNTVCDAIPSASTSEAGSVRDAPAGREASDTTDYSMDTDGAIPAAASTAVPFLEKLKMKRKKKNLDLLADLEIVPLKDQIDGSQLVAKWKKRFVRVKAAATVAHLCRYIVTRLMIESQRTVDASLESFDLATVNLFIRPRKNNFQLLDHGKTLSEIQKEYKIEGRLALAFELTEHIKLSKKH